MLLKHARGGGTDRGTGGERLVIQNFGAKVKDQARSIYGL